MPIQSTADIARGLEKLIAQDLRLKEIARIAGPLPLRRRPADFEGLAQIVTAQQVSVASASAIFQRVKALAEPLDARALNGLTDEDLAGAGLSRPKIKTLRAVAQACHQGLDLEGLATCPAEDAHARLCTIKGIGRWSADIFLLFCAGHPDVFPSGDLALQIAVGAALNLPGRPAAKEVDTIAEAWAPHRAIAARLFWAWYKVQKEGRETLPV